MKRPTIIQAIESKRVFGSLPRFRSLDTWASWLVVLKAIFGLPMTPDDLVVFHTHTGRASPPLGGLRKPISSSGGVAEKVSSPPSSPASCPALGTSASSSPSVRL